ncbi:nucleotidyltransferase family protein [Microbacteriaceae bacterium VKM Ac-2854]|nr:nucleotidyltransferase family protein [Microbacteriaceae bacterium VKM Ac-2854]
MTTTSHEFPLGVAGEFAHTLAHHVAGIEGIRLLSIKGPVLADQGLRAPRLSADADVWVEPARLDDFRAAMELRGWGRRFTRETPWIIEHHADGFVHENWPVDIDIHHTYPGCFADKQLVFETLWARRTTVQMAGREVATTDRIGSLLIMILHALREPQSHRQQDELAHAVELLSEDSEMRAELFDLAHKTGAAGPVVPVLREAGMQLVLPFDGFQSRHQRRVWSYFIATNGVGAASSWLAQLVRSPLHKLPALIWHALYPTREEIHISSFIVAETRRARTVYRLKRLARGTRHALHALRSVLRAGVDR